MAPLLWSSLGQAGQWHGQVCEGAPALHEASPGSHRQGGWNCHRGGDWEVSRAATADHPGSAVTAGPWGAVSASCL